MVYINRAWIARIKEESSSLNIRFPNAIFLFISNINPSLTSSKHKESRNCQGYMSVFVIDKIRRAAFKPYKGQRTRGKDRNIRRRIVRGRRNTISDRGNSNSSQSASNMVLSEIDTVSLSITEAEYIACSEGAKDASWTRQFLNELPLTIRMQPLPILYTDNEAANKLSKNHAYHRVLAT
jgi:hypothetical protein